MAEPWHQAFTSALSAKDYAAALRLASDPQAGPAIGSNGMTGLHELAMHAREIEVPIVKELLQELIRSGVPVDAVNGDPRTALLLIQRPGTYWMIADLVAAGANPDWEGPGHYTSLFLNSILSGDQDEISETLIAAGADVNYRVSKCGATALLFVATIGNAKNMAALVRLGADVHVRNNDGTGVVHELALCDHEAAIRQSPWLRPLVDQRDATGQTPLMIAALIGQPNTVAALLDAGTNTALTDEDGLTAMDYADMVAEPGRRMATQALLLGVSTENSIHEDEGGPGGQGVE